MKLLSLVFGAICASLLFWYSFILETTTYTIVILTLGILLSLTLSTYIGLTKGRYHGIDPNKRWPYFLAILSMTAVGIAMKLFYVYIPIIFFLILVCIFDVLVVYGLPTYMHRKEIKYGLIKTLE